MSAAPETGTAKQDWTRRELHVRGVRLSYIESKTAAPETPDREAEPAGAPILMLHGLVAGGDCFRLLADQLSPGRRIIALDLPGGGFSDRLTDRDINFQSIAHLVAEAIPELGMHRPILLGHSYGGAIALQLAATFPELVAAMVLIAPAHPFSGHEYLLIRFYLSVAGRRFAHLLPRLPRRVLLEGFRRMPGAPADATFEQVETYLETLRYPGTVAHILRLLETWKQDMLTLREALKLRRPAMPALLLWGDRDPIVPADTAAELARYLPASEQTIIPGASHLPNLDHPGECATLINSWLLTLERNPAGKVAAPFVVQSADA